MGWELCKAVRCSEQSAKNVQPKGACGAINSAVLFGQAEPRLQKQGRRGALEPSLWDFSAFSSLVWTALPQKSSAVQPHISSLLPSSHGQWNKINSENIIFFFSLTRPLPPLFCLSLSHPTGTSTEWWQSLRKVILNYFEGQAVCFWMERRGWIFFRTFMLVYIKSTLHKIERLRKVKELEKS